jgi:8-amino-7-oxononanoate synthase
MTHWLNQLREDLRQRELLHLARRLDPIDRCQRLVHRGGRTLLNLAANDYLALASHPHLCEAVAAAAMRLGVGSGASRLVTGHLAVHREVELRFAAFKHAEAALLLPSGYMANLAVLTTLAAPGDLVCLDKLNHASLIDAAQASSAEVRVYPHNNVDKLARLLERGRAARRRFIVTDSVFSMDGDVADLPALCDLRDEHDAILILDEAHATGTLGPTGAGLAELCNLSHRVDIAVSTASKALGSLGGLVTGPQAVIDTLINHARPFIYTTAVPPTQAAAIAAALDVLAAEPHRRLRLSALSSLLRSILQKQGWPVPADPTPIVPLIIGDAAAALRLSHRLEEAGFLIPAIRPPTVPPNSARLRITLRCDLLDEDLHRLAAAIGPRPPA